eukprot:CAMPEP_0205814866 /NCGR_PEP_ID=MMETSP0205-20121125/20268_1 /ASSEMBLY_ACC=CAM_ASM_000278 /TAXON_ID=36767 /ORGANISM="Euplotes focardii, Strain TN1" /LENGTH=58 /DNA_ID=CAMNT_0053099869 /DNA_START=491 /DNA_END=667 /DNA_ORIENTATION=+
METNLFCGGEGAESIEFLGLPEDVVPATYKKVKMARANADEDEKKEGAEDSETKGKDY